MNPDVGVLHLNAVAASVTTLGPSPAAAIWVQGCDIGCRDCMSAHTWGRAAGALARVSDVADWAEATGRRNLTISGGEPMDQARALTELVTELRLRDSWTVTCYSGYSREDLDDDRPPGSRSFLDHLDILIDGPYREEEHRSLLWRGSANQRVHLRSPDLEIGVDESAGIELLVEPDGAVSVVGVPDRPSFTAELAAKLELAEEYFTQSGHPAFPFPVMEVS